MEYIQNSLIPHEADITASTFDPIEIMAEQLGIQEIQSAQNGTLSITQYPQVQFSIYGIICGCWLGMSTIWILLLCIYRKKHAIKMLYCVTLVPLTKLLFLVGALTRFGLCGFGGIQCEFYSTTYQVMYLSALPYYAALSTCFILISLGWGTTKRYISCVDAILLSIGVAITEAGYLSMILLSTPLVFNITLFVVGISGYVLLYKQIRLLSTQTIMYKHIDPSVNTKLLPPYQKYFVLKVFIAILGFFFMLRFLGWIITWIIEQFVGNEYSEITRIIAQSVLDEVGEFCCLLILGLTIRPRDFSSFDAFNHSSDLYGVENLILGRNQRNTQQRNQPPQQQQQQGTTTTTTTTTQQEENSLKLGKLDSTMVQTLQAESNSSIWKKDDQFKVAIIVRHAQRSYPLSLATSFNVPTTM